MTAAVQTPRPVPDADTVRGDAGYRNAEIGDRLAIVLDHDGHAHPLVVTVSETTRLPCGCDMVRALWDESWPDPLAWALYVELVPASPEPACGGHEQTIGENYLHARSAAARIDRVAAALLEHAQGQDGDGGTEQVATAMAQALWLHRDGAIPCRPVHLDPVNLVAHPQHRSNAA